MTERNLCFKALVGSYNYNLQTVQSDKDYKIFFYPNFDDLYEGGQYSRAIVSSDEDVEYHDIRKLPYLLYKSNVNFMEVLFSEEYEVYDHALFSKIIALRDQLAMINIPYLYDACYGMYVRKMKEFARDKVQDLQTKTCKHAMSAYRILDFLERYHNITFCSFKQAIQYEVHNSTRELLLNIRKEKFTFTQLEKMIVEKEANVKKLEKAYKSMEANQHLKEMVDNIVKENVKKNLIKSLK